MTPAGEGKWINAATPSPLAVAQSTSTVTFLRSGGQGKRLGTTHRAASLLRDKRALEAELWFENGRKRRPPGQSALT